jgi:hypothetical protein
MVTVVGDEAELTPLVPLTNVSNILRHIVLQVHNPPGRLRVVDTYTLA